MIRLYIVSYLEDDELLSAVIPEFLLPEIEDIESIEVAGWLVEGYTIVKDEETDPGEKEPIPLIANLTK